ncbi:hypothetical protein [Larsenimonas rhizosphaerae]|uniref:Uncharacterized protein n=1 Tax=Larsenimonas rhizosphaerae TaxID=2944682 RepID=A0AA41ZJX8_9GAMM|nr:hypothetical protein [Larsenimonas rhizosphaerae]MCX2522958.1 hypothetical protein [Larsenimonas rhizosphaerae]
MNVIPVAYGVQKFTTFMATYFSTIIFIVAGDNLFASATMAAHSVIHVRIPCVGQVAILATLFVGA